jgi:pimeloyl-ACP methyl ester carboxylesterase
VDDIAEVLRHPYRKRVDVVRPGGRSVEVTIAGDLLGKPLVFLQTCYAYTFEAAVEHKFHDAGYCVLSICRPGTGNTDPASDGQSYYEAFAGDLSALLDQLGFETCLLMTSNTSAGFLFHALPHVAKRVSGIVLAAAGPPMCYVNDQDSAAPWVKGMLRAAKKSDFFLNLMLKSGISGYRAIGQERFLSIQREK